MADNAFVVENEINEVEKKKLLEAAVTLCSNAYCPYSNFGVGSALLTSDGTIFTGCNVECCVYPAGICAETVAVGKAVSAGFTAFTAIAVAGPGAAPVAPCGACRQILAEFCCEPRPDLLVLSAGENGTSREWWLLKDLLPHTFTRKHISKDHRGEPTKSTPTS